MIGSQYIDTPDNVVQPSGSDVATSDQMEKTLLSLIGNPDKKKSVYSFFKTVTGVTKINTLAGIDRENEYKTTLLKVSCIYNVDGKICGQKVSASYRGSHSPSNLRKHMTGTHKLDSNTWLPKTLTNVQSKITIGPGYISL